jgi:hypothetical protein
MEYDQPIDAMISAPVFPCDRVNKSSKQREMRKAVGDSLQIQSTKRAHKCDPENATNSPNLAGLTCGSWLS